MESVDLKYRMLLASSSPRRKELISYLGIPFDVIVPDFNEEVISNDPLIAVESIISAKLKSAIEFQKSVSIPQGLSPFVLVSDTVVINDGSILGKPQDREHAKAMLLSLQGHLHQVMTGVGLAFIRNENWEFHQVYSTTEVEFDVIDPFLLEHYLNGGESLDKAGAYGIQSGGQVFVKRVNGNYSNVVGLPLSLVVDKLSEVFRPKHWSSFFA